MAPATNSHWWNILLEERRKQRQTMHEEWQRVRQMSVIWRTDTDIRRIIGQEVQAIPLQLPAIDPRLYGPPYSTTAYDGPTVPIEKPRFRVGQSRFRRRRS